MTPSNGDRPLLTEHQREVVRLIEQGYTRWKIAELIGSSEDAVRQTIRRLCQRFDCRMEDLPAVIEDAEEVGT